MRIIRLIALLAPWGLLGCAVQGYGPRIASTFAAPAPQDGGIEIARATMVPGASANAAVASDCYGPGLGVLVESRLGQKKAIFDAAGEPCAAAQVLFDGAKASGQRAADPTITIRVHDALGTMLDEREDATTPAGANSRLRAAAGLPPVPVIKVSDELLQELSAKAQADENGPTQPDPLLQTLNQWRRADRVVTERTAESAEAGTRELGRLVRAAESNSSSAAAAELAQQLRERERTLAETQRRMAETMGRSAENRSVTQAARDAWQTEQTRLQNELEIAKARAAQFEQLASRLQSDGQRKEVAYGARISTLASNLRVAEAQADVGRRQLIMQAAAKIAEAEALAKAAKIEAQSDQLAEASRLQAEANELMDKVLMARGEGGAQSIEPAAGPAATAASVTAGALPLLEAPVALQAKERTLPEMLTEVLQQAAPHSGAWRAEWQLGTAGAPILQEKWSLTAEATVGQILERLQAQVQAVHKLRLKITMFTQTRVLVISLEDK